MNNLLQGTTADQDNRFSDKEKKLLKTMKYEESITTKVRTLLMLKSAPIRNAIHPYKSDKNDYECLNVPFGNTVL